MKKILLLALFFAPLAFGRDSQEEEALVIDADKCLITDMQILCGKIQIVPVENSTILYNDWLNAGGLGTTSGKIQVIINHIGDDETENIPAHISWHKDPKKLSRFHPSFDRHIDIEPISKKHPKYRLHHYSPKKLAKIKQHKEKILREFQRHKVDK